MKILLAGEGSTDLGDWARHPSDRPVPPRRGVIESLLRRVRSEGWEVVGAKVWKNIRKYKSGGHATAEMRNVLGVALEATETGCDVLAFARDRDGHLRRAAEIEKGITMATNDRDPRLAIIGGVAIEEIESWILSLRGEANAEAMRHPKEHLRAQAEQLGFEASTASMVTDVEAANIDNVSATAHSLHTWIGRAREVLLASRP